MATQAHTRESTMRGSWLAAGDGSCWLAAASPAGPGVAPHGTQQVPGCSAWLLLRPLNFS